MFQFVAAVFAASSALCFLSYLIFLGYVIRETGSTDGLPNVAVAIRAFKFPFRSEKESPPEIYPPIALVKEETDDAVSE